MTNLNNNPGILPYLLGTAKVKSSIHTFLHYYDLLPIRNEIQILKLAFKNVTEAIQIGLSYPYHIELENFIKGVSFQLNSAENKLNSLMPSIRVKRGLFNGLGNVIKVISGNLDADDALRYDEAISALQNSQQEIVNNLNQQISLTSDIIQNFNETMNLIKHNQDIIFSGIEKIRNSLNTFIFEFDDYLQTRNILDQLNLNINIILQILGEIENAIAFARLGILHTGIIKIEEMEKMVYTVLKFHTVDEILFQNLENDTYKYYGVLDVESYYSGTKIMYSYYHLYSIPTPNSTTIIPHNTYLIMNDDFYQYIQQPCIKLETSHYCPGE